MGYFIAQIPCPSCGHEQHDMVMEHKDLVKNEYVEAICSECREAYAKPIIGPDDPDYDVLVDQ